MVRSETWTSTENRILNIVCPIRVLKVPTKPSVEGGFDDFEVWSRGVCTAGPRPVISVRFEISSG